MAGMLASLGIAKEVEGVLRQKNRGVAGARVRATEWVEIAKIIPTEDARPNSNAYATGFNAAVKLEGGELVVSATNADGVGPDTGAVYVFNEDPINGQWKQKDKLVASDGLVGDAFGNHIDWQGNTIVVGAFGADPVGSGSGASYVFEREGDNWSQVTRLLSSNIAAADQFGSTVGINNGIILVGGMRSDGVIADGRNSHISLRSLRVASKFRIDRTWAI